MQGCPMSTSVITALITNRALCRECIATKTKMKPEAVDTAMRVIARGVKIDHYANGVCADCHNDRLVYAIDRPHSRG